MIGYLYNSAVTIVPVGTFCICKRDFMSCYRDICIYFPSILWAAPALGWQFLLIHRSFSMSWDPIYWLSYYMHCERTYKKVLPVPVCKRVLLLLSPLEFSEHWVLCWSPWSIRRRFCARWEIWIYLLVLYVDTQVFNRTICWWDCLILSILSPLCNSGVDQNPGGCSCVDFDLVLHSTLLI